MIFIKRRIIDRLIKKDLLTEHNKKPLSANNMPR